jgi:hypothetical protein
MVTLMNLAMQEKLPVPSKIDISNMDYLTFWGGTPFVLLVHFSVYDYR